MSNTDSIQLVELQRQSEVLNPNSHLTSADEQGGEMCETKLSQNNN